MMMRAGYSKRDYRSLVSQEDFKDFRLVVKETDLQIRVDKKSYREQLPFELEKYVYALRKELEKYIEIDPDFFHTLGIHLVGKDAPPIVHQMAKAGNMASVGPMAAVAGAFAQEVGKEILSSCQEVIVENGGDIFIKSSRPRQVAVFAGESPFSYKIALKVEAKNGLAVCTSSGTVGPSKSFGKADAAIILSSSASLADAVATATANKIRTSEDLEKALKFAQNIEGVKGILLIIGKHMTAWAKPGEDVMEIVKI